MAYYSTSMKRQAVASTARQRHTCDEGDRRRCRACRWFEVTIEVNYTPGEASETSTRYKVVIVGRTRVPGEFDRVTIERTSSPSRVIEFLAIGRPGERRVPRVSRLALAEAREWSPALWDALLEFDRNNSRSQ